MKNRIRRICNNLVAEKSFINYWTVLFIDVVLSVVSTYITLLFVNSFVLGDNGGITFSVLVYSGFISTFVFYFFENR